MLLIQHDIYANVLELTQHVLDKVKAKGWKGKSS